MNGLILLEDLEEDVGNDSVYSKSPSQQRKNRHYIKYKSDFGGCEPEIKRASNLKDTNGGYPNHLMVDGPFHRRKSISAEPLPVESEVLKGDSDPSGDPQTSINGHYSSLSSVNNAITVAPSRTTFLEPNVYAGGRSHHSHHNGHRKQHHHRKHKGRSRSPDDHGVAEDEGYQSILSRIDNSILKNFGDWNNLDDEGPQRTKNNRKDNRSNNQNNNNNERNNMLTNGQLRTNTVPYFIPKHVMNDLDDLSNGFDKNSNHNDLLSLPRLYKGYDTVVKTSKKVLNEASHCLALSKDNSDPNSVLSEAKRTLLAQFGGHAD